MRKKELLEEARKLFYEMSDFKHLPPFAKSGCKEMYYTEVEPVVEYVLTLLGVEE